MDWRFIPVFLCFPCTLFLPSSAWCINRGIEHDDTFEFWLGLVGLLICPMLLEWGLCLVQEIWEEEVRRHPPDWKGAKPNPVKWLCLAIIVLTQINGLMMYATTMDGGVRFAATRWVYLVYFVPAFVILVGRWRNRTWIERMFLRWGWAPILAFGIPFALPELRASGLIRGPLD
jgi:hypothetical protein